MALVLLAIVPPAARAQESADPAYAFAAAGQWTVELQGSGVVDVTNRDVQMVGPVVGVSYYLVENVAAHLELGGYWVEQDVDTTTAAGSLMLRHHVWHRDDWSVFLEVGGGLVQSDEPIPAGGTDFNYTFQTGVGVTHPVGSAGDTWLVAGVRFYHLSNADSEGDDRNPSVNGPMGFVGLMWMLR